MKWLSFDDAQTPKFPGGLTNIHAVKDTDVFVVGFPKSGNTLMQHIMAHLVYGFNAEASRSMINLVVPDIYANSHYFRFNDRCFFKSHELPRPNYKKVIYIIRDGSEALLSYHRMMENMGKPVPLKDLFTGKEKILNTTWANHIKAWESNPYQADILWVNYEDLKSNKLQEIERICKFLELSRTQDELENVVAFTSLDHMRMLEKRADWQLMKKANNFNTGTFVRSEDNKSNTRIISDEDLRLFNKTHEDLLKKYFKTRC
ncbi:sulfotransferase domain-containing protein [uncultured Psychroserpens sp.]|uniref:sulfotransferase domain-containing protein n=1 Tax=uncultured Psychroserpens sp. TaxID=255436 RepID=UPI002632C1FD|nr:sulfotransferase domain-containing protein [uncultured Psychroserpens sp.]